MRVVAYTDGASRGNPGPGGYGVVLLYVDPSGVEHRKEVCQGYYETTNNRMELMAAAVALESLKRPCVVELHSDSQYVVNAFNQHWIYGWMRKGWKTSQRKPVSNKELWLRLIDAAKPHEVTWVWVKGHAGNPLNERADELATRAADGLEGPLLDDVPEQEESLQDSLMGI